jgi:Holliday junction resolvasome RuvABC DNA-binding subunit
VILVAKKEEFIPTDLVKRLYNEGKGETEVITQLRAQGFTPSQIDKALKAVPKPKHAEPHGLPVKQEAYRGPLPKEVIRPVSRAEAPEHRPFTPEPLGNEEIGSTSEDINIPDELKPIDIVGHAPPKSAPSKREKEEHLPPPAPVSAGIAAAPKISLEEMTEAIVNEQEKKLYAHLDRLQADHDANVKKINDIGAKLDALAAELKVLERAVDAKSSFAADSNKELAVKVEALETAFKGLAHLLHKK